MLPVSRQRGVVVIMPVGSTWPFRGLEAGKELTAWDLAGEGWDRESDVHGWSFPENWAVPTGHPECNPPPPTLTLLGGGGLGEH